MKNQNDLIVAGVAFVLAVIVVCVAMFTKRDPVNPGAPAEVDVKMPSLPANDVVMADSLPGSQNGGAGGGGGGNGLSRAGAPGGMSASGAGMSSRGGGAGAPSGGMSVQSSGATSRTGG